MCKYKAANFLLSAIHILGLGHELYPHSVLRVKSLILVEDSVSFVRQATSI